MRGPLGNPRSFKSFCTKRESQTRSDRDSSDRSGNDTADGHCQASGGGDDAGVRRSATPYVWTQMIAGDHYCASMIIKDMHV